MIEGLFQPMHLVLILAIIMIVFGAGKLPEMGGAVGRGIREFRKEVQEASESGSDPGRTDSDRMTATAEKPMNFSFCTSCGEQTPTNARFCPSCGAAVATEVTPASVNTSEVEATAIAQESSAV